MDVADDSQALHMEHWTFDTSGSRVCAAPGMDHSVMENQQLRLGSTTYRVLKRVGAGGMAEVFKASMLGDASLIEKTVALKKILPNLTRNSNFRNNFINEANVCAQLRHPNIVEVYNFHQDRSDLYLAMEFIDGVSLEDMLEAFRRQNRLLDTSELTAIVLQVLDGLNYAHNDSPVGRDLPDPKDRGVIHRDLKPSNILINFNGVVKIVDFGVAKAAGRKFETQEMTTKGTASYMAPEQIIGEPPVSHRSDLFSIGAILYELVTMKRLFDGDNVFAILRQVTDLNLEDHLNKTITRADRKFLPMLRKSLARDPATRYATAAEMIKDFLPFRDLAATREQLGKLVRAVALPNEDPFEEARTTMAPAPRSVRRTDDGDPTRAGVSPIRADRDEEDAGPATVYIPPAEVAGARSTGVGVASTSAPAIPVARAAQETRPLAKPGVSGVSPAGPVGPSQTSQVNGGAPSSAQARAPEPPRVSQAGRPGVTAPGALPALPRQYSGDREGPGVAVPAPSPRFSTIQQKEAGPLIPVLLGAGIGLVILLLSAWIFSMLGGKVKDAPNPPVQQSPAR